MKETKVPTGAAPYLRIERLTKQFGTFSALNDISLEILPGEFVCFLGPSGCGKTTLLRAIAGLDIQTSGRIFQGDKEISTLPASRSDAKLRGPIFGRNSVAVKLPSAFGSAISMKLPRGQICSASLAI